MKFLPLSGAAKRQDRENRLRRERLATPALRTLYPKISQLRIELQFKAESNIPASQSHVLHPPASAFFSFPCPYAACDGRYHLGDAVGAAIANASLKVQGTMDCAGERLQEHGGRQPCGLRLAYRISASREAESIAAG